MSAVLLNSLNELGNEIKCEVYNEFYQFSNTGALICYLFTLKLRYFKN